MEIAKKKIVTTDEELELALLEQAADGTKDGYKNLESLRKKNMLNKLIAEKFGIGEEE